MVVVGDPKYYFLFHLSKHHSSIRVSPAVLRHPNAESHIEGRRHNMM